MIRVNLLLETALQGAKITNQYVLNEIHRISESIGRDFTQFLHEDGDQIYLEAPEGALSPKNWNRLPPYGNNRNLNPDTPEGFALFFLVATTLPLTEHQEEWAGHCWSCWDRGKSPIIEASRGFGKSIFMRNLLVYLVGLYPHLESLIIRAADAPAKKSAEGIANIIVNNQAWKLFFPHVEPKSRPGQAGGEWAAGTGYSVIDRSVDPDEWVAMEASRTSPTISKFGIGGAGVLGSRTSNTMLADDLHADQETPNEVQRIVTRFVSAVEPTRQPHSRLALIGTPWGFEDLLQVLPPTGQYEKIQTPITVEGTWPGTPRWPEMFDEEAIQAIYEADPTPGKREFMKNRLLQLIGDFDKHFTFRMYKHVDVKDWWFKRIGIDYAAGEGIGPERSYFALAVGAQEPESGAWIVIDGVVARVTQSQAERLLLEYWNKYANVEAVIIEQAAGGKEFEHSVARMANWSIPMLGEPPGSQQKERRWETDLEPALAGERLMISDNEDNIFLLETRHALRRYPNIGKRGDKAADILDALYWLIYHAIVAHADPVRRDSGGKKKRNNPWKRFLE